MNRTLRWRPAWTFPLVILLIVAAFYWKLTLTYQFDWIWGPDLAQQVLPWLEEEARQVQHGRVPLWDPHTWAGQPMLGQAQPGTAYPLNWLLFLAPRQKGHIAMWALQWYFIAIHYMAALFCFLLCRDLGRSRAASLIAGLIFSLAGYVGTTDWPQMINGAVWAPLVLLFLLRAGRGVRPLASAALAGMFLGIAWLSGHHQVPIYISLTAAGVWLFYVLRGGFPNFRMIGCAALCFTIAILVGSLQIVPAEEYGHLALRWAGAPEPLAWDQPVPYYVHQRYSLYPMSLFAIVIPAMNRNADPFIGVVALALAILAIALGWKHHAVKVFAAIGIGGLVYSLGHNSVFHGFLYAALPVVDKARVPSMAVLIFNIGAAVLAAFGIDHFDSEVEAPWRRRIAMGALAFGVVLYTVILNAFYVRKGWEVDDRVALTAMIAILLAALLYGWLRGNLSRRAALSLATLLLLLELGNDSGFAFANRADEERRSYIEKVWGNDDLADYLNQQVDRPFRIETTTSRLVPNWAGYHNFDAIKALCASATANILNSEWHSWNTRMLFGVRYSLGDKPERPEQQEVYTSASGIKLFYNPHAFPRTWTVHEIAHLDNPNAGMFLVGEHLEDLHAKAFMTEAPPKLAACGAVDQVHIDRYEAEKIDFSAAMACDGMLVISDTYYPGWEAKVDGKSAPMHQVNGAMRGVVVPQGAHQVTMRYRPKSVYLGAALTVIGVLATLFLVFFRRREDRAH